MMRYDYSSLLLFFECVCCKLFVGVCIPKIVERDAKKIKLFG
jgi:hypothetical protein